MRFLVNIFFLQDHKPKLTQLFNITQYHWVLACKTSSRLDSLLSVCPSFPPRECSKILCRMPRFAAALVSIVVFVTAINYVKFTICTCIEVALCCEQRCIVLTRCGLLMFKIIQ